MKIIYHSSENIIENSIRPLQQFFYRKSEKEIREKLKPSIDTDTIKFFGRHNECPLPLGFSVHSFQYKKLKIKSIFISIDSLSDRCCILRDLSVCIVHNIFEINNLYYLLVKTFEIVRLDLEIGRFL